MLFRVVSSNRIGRWYLREKIKEKIFNEIRNMFDNFWTRTVLQNMRVKNKRKAEEVFFFFLELPLKTHCLLLESVKCDNITNSRISFKSISITHAWSPSRMSWAINNGSSLSRVQFSKAFLPVVSLELKVIDGDDLWLVNSIRKCIRKLPQILKTK